MPDPEEWLADTLVTLADTLVADFDLVEFLSTLVERIVELLDAAGAGLMLVDTQGDLRVMASSTEQTRLLDLFEVQASQGPCLDCYRSGKAILNVALEGSLERWPLFAPMARSEGFEMVHALPMRWHDQVIGAANIFHITPVTLTDHVAHLAQAVADIATIGIMQERTVRRNAELAEQLQVALNSRIVVEQAKGALAERTGVDVETAFAWLRSYARNKNLRLADVASAVLEHALPADALRTSSTVSPGTH